MPQRKDDIDARRRRQARHLYEETKTPATQIAALLGIDRRTLTARARRWGWRLRQGRQAAVVENTGRGAGSAPDGPAHAPDLPLPLPASATASEAEAAPLIEPEAADLTEKVGRAVERELAAIESILARLGDGEERAAIAERAARTLASLTRTLAAVQRLRPPASGDGEPSGAADGDDDRPGDDLPRDIDEFRRELARRIDAFVAGRSDAGLPGNGGE